MYDFLIVGAGLFGATLARELTDARKRVLVVEQAGHVGGMCHTTERHGIITQEHGGHIYHTNDRRLWEYVQRFGEWRQYSHHVKVRSGRQVYSFPINLMTLQQVFGVTTRAEAERLMRDVREPAEGDNLRDHCLRTVGRRLYEMFIEGYTRKQWGKDPAELPASIIKRIPVRLDWNDEYFADTYQGMPVKGYTPLIEAMLHKITVVLNEDYCSRRAYWDFKAAKTIYSGPLDKLFGCMVGALEYRSLRFEHERIDVEDWQGCPTMNYVDSDIPYTRVHEHKHWYPVSAGHTLITREYPAAYDGTNEPYYPLNDERNQALFGRYAQMAKARGVLYGGRMGSYRYMDMHQVIAQALTVARDCLN